MVCIAIKVLITAPLSLVPRPSEGEGEGRPGIHCMRSSSDVVNRSMKASEQRGHAFSVIASTKVGRSSRIL